MTFQKTLAVALAWLGASAAYAADQQAAPLPDKPMTVSAGRLENIPIHAVDDPHSLVIYVSDRSGWKTADDKNVKALQADGNVVLAIDFSRYAAKLDAGDGECLYVVGELTDLSQTAERQLGIQSYLPPIIVGSGEGATFAYAALAATYNQVRFIGMPPAITQRVAFASAKLRAIFQQYVADVKQRARGRTRQSTQGRLHPDRR